MVPRSVAQVLADHVTLRVECIDRMYLNVYVPQLQFVNGVVSFLRNHRGHAIASSAMLEPISREFVASIHRFVKQQGLPLIDFTKGQRKDDVAHQHLAQFKGDEGVLFVGRAQERTSVNRKRPAGLRPRRGIVRASGEIGGHAKARPR